MFLHTFEEYDQNMKNINFLSKNMIHSLFLIEKLVFYGSQNDENLRFLQVSTFFPKVLKKMKNIYFFRKVAKKMKMLLFCSDFRHL